MNVTGLGLGAPEDDAVRLLTVIVEVWPGVIEAGLKEHVTSVEQPSVTD